MISETPGTICLPTSEIGRFTMFVISLAATEQPTGSNLSVMAGASVTENLNASLRGLRDEDGWAWVIGDDHVWQGDCLMRLLKTMDEHPEIDVLVPLVTKRNPPWHVVVFHAAGAYDEGILTVNGGRAAGLPAWRPFAWEEIPESGVFECDAAGSAGMLIRRRVLDAIGDPWFESSDGVFLNEDLNFCAKARARGFRIFATADAVMGHLGIFNVRPLRHGGRWGALTEFSTPEEQFRSIFMPDAEEHAAATHAR